MPYSAIRPGRGFECSLVKRGIEILPRRRTCGSPRRSRTSLHSAKPAPMDSQQARFVLSVYRPDVGLERDPLIAEAIEPLCRDSELARWFAGQLEFDETIARLLQEHNPPPDARSQIMTCLRVTTRIAQQRRLCTVRSLIIGLVIALGCGCVLGWLIAR